jgi:hypothetical protein
LAIAAWIGKTRCRFLGQRMFYLAGSKLWGSCRCWTQQAITRHLVAKKIPRPLR